MSDVIKPPLIRPVHQLCKWSSVSNLFNNVLSHDSLWTILYSNAFPNSSPPIGRCFFGGIK